MVSGGFGLFRSFSGFFRPKICKIVGFYSAFGPLGRIPPPSGLADPSKLCEIVGFCSVLRPPSRFRPWCPGFGLGVRQASRIWPFQFWNSNFGTRLGFEDLALGFGDLALGFRDLGLEGARLRGVGRSNFGIPILERV